MFVLVVAVVGAVVFAQLYLSAPFICRSWRLERVRAVVGDAGGVVAGDVVAGRRGAVAVAAVIFADANAPLARRAAAEKARKADDGCNAAGGVSRPSRFVKDIRSTVARERGGGLAGGGCRGQFGRVGEADEVFNASGGRW